MKGARIVTAVAIFCLLSCMSRSDFSVSDDSAMTVISNVVVSDVPGNVLRKELSLDLDVAGNISVEFWKKGDEKHKRIVASERPALHHDIMLVIMEPDSEYILKVTSGENHHITGFCTEALPDGMIRMTDQMPDMTYEFDGYIHVADKAKGTLYLVDYKGTVVWYEGTFGKSVISSSYDPRTKSFQAIVGFNPAENFTGELIYVVDLYGHVLMKKYFHELDNPFFHHDISMLPNGNLLVINQIRQKFDLSHVGGSAEETVTGDGITLLDLSGKTLWTWSAFDEISPEDDPDIMLNDPEFQYNGVDDWLHANSLIADDNGNMYISFNKNSQVWKISPEGRVLFKLGRNGDVELDNPDNFSDRQHSVSLIGGESVMIYDNGYSSKCSRAIAYSVDEKNHKAETVLLFNLRKEDFSPNQSSVYRIDDDNFIYASTVPGIVAITDRYGNVKWRYKSSAPIFRAVYIDGI